MKSVLTTYIEATEAIQIDQEAERLEVSKSEYLAVIVCDRAARRRAEREIKQARKLEGAAA